MLDKANLGLLTTLTHCSSAESRKHECAAQVPAAIAGSPFACRG